MKRAVFALVALLSSAGLGACSHRAADETVSATEDRMTPLDRLLIGRATQYPADLGMRATLPQLQASQHARRAAAWAVARRVLAPVAVAGTHTLPRFQTWYAREEILPIFDRLLRGQTPAELAARTPPTAAAIDRAFAWEADRATTLPDWSEERLARRRAEFEADGAASLGGPERVLMSPALVGHLYANYDSILRCIGRVPPAGQPPAAEDNFAPCVGTEFPEGAVIVKARWVPDTLALDVYDTSASALSSTLAAGEWGAPSRTATPDERSIYTMRLPSGLRMRLAALHIITKELRDWMWVSLFWSDTPRTDFGADGPADLGGPFANYKMCAVVGYDEGHEAADEGSARSLGPGNEASLERALAATREFGPRTWCSNPYLEHGKGNAKTNCIGCHQHGGTDLTTATILEGPSAFPDGSRAKLRSNFPADYTFITTTGLELASLMKAKVEQLSPSPLR